MNKPDMDRIHAMADRIKERLETQPDLDLGYITAAQELFDLISEVDLILKDRELTDKDRKVILRKLNKLMIIIKESKRRVQ